MSEQPNENQFTEKERAELEAARLERVKAETELLQLQKELSETQRQEREARQRRTIRDAAASTVKFHNLDIVEKLARADYDLAFDETTGEATGLLNGRRVDLPSVFKAIALGNEHLVDGRSLRSLKDAQERKDAESEVLCKSEMDLPTKMKYIEEHGLPAFEALPLRRPRITQVKSFEDYLELPLKQRMAYVERHGSDAAAKLPRRQK